MYCRRGKSVLLISQMRYSPILPLFAIDPDIDAVITMLPRICLLTICRAAAWIVRNVPVSQLV